MTRAPASPRPAGRRGRLPAGRLAALLALGFAAGCEDGGTGPAATHYGQVGRIRVEVTTPLARGDGALRQTLTWGSSGTWRFEERITYRDLAPGDESVHASATGLPRLALEYASLVAQIDTVPGLQLFLGDFLPPALDPTCVFPQSRVRLTIADDLDADSTTWTRCANGTLRTLSAEAAGPDPAAGRVVQAAQLVRNSVLPHDSVYAYVGSLPFGTLDRGEQSNALLTVPRAIEDAATFATFWEQHTGDAGAAPAVDFARDMVLVGAAGSRPEAGDSLEVRRVVRIEGGSQVELWEVRPGDFCTPAARAHVPYHVVVAPRLARPLSFSVVDTDRKPCG